MKIKRIIILLVALLFVTPVFAEGSIKGIEKSKYETTDNSYNRVEIKNVNEDNDYIEGSKFQIQDENGIVLYEFTTPKNIFVVEGLEKGNYYLVQTNVLSSYTLNTEKMLFSVKDDIVYLNFINKNVEILPGSMTSLSILIIFMGMLDITILIGVIVYVKKNKIKQ